MAKRLALTLIAALFIVQLTACSGGNQQSSSSGAAASSRAGEPGSITIAGSTALLPLVKQAAVDYQAKHANVKISVSGGGSMTGIAQAAQKGVDIGDSDVLPQNEPSLVDHKVAVVPFGVVVNSSVNVKNLSTPQIRDIFSGKLTNWSQVGAASRQITMINRPRSSGTRSVFVQTIMSGAQPSESGLTQDSSGTVATMVAQTPGAISYVALSYVKPGVVKALSIDGVAPNRANIESGKYHFWSYEHMLTNGQPSAQIADFINFVKTDTPLLTKLGFIPVDAMKVSK
jgi:phosphate transport system substrate-binding protein